MIVVGDTCLAVLRRVESLGNQVPRAARGGGGAGGRRGLVPGVLRDRRASAHQLSVRLEWLEGGSLDTLPACCAGTPYAPPSLDFTPYIYAPLYYYLAAPFAKLFGLRLLSLRLVSLAASLGVLALIAALVHGRTRSRLGALVAAGLFAALFKRSGAFADLARVDSLALFFLLLAVWLLLAGERRDVIAGALLAAAFLTKQSMLLIAAPIVLTRTWSRRGRRGCRRIAAFVALALGGCVMLHLRTHGSSTYYLFSLPASHPWVSAAWVGYWRSDIFAAVPVAVLALGLVIARAAGVGVARPLELVAVLGSLAGAWSSRLHSGGYDNVLMPAYACLAWQTGVVLGWLSRPASDAPRAKMSRFVRGLAPSAAWRNLRCFGFHPGGKRPQPRIGPRAPRWSRRIAAVPGPVLVPYHPHLARLAGKGTYAHEMALADVMRGQATALGADALAADVGRRLRARAFAAVIVDQDWWPAELNASYVSTQPLFIDDHAVFWPMTGWPTRPRALYEPRP